MKGHTALQALAISRQPPREFRETSITLLLSRHVSWNHRNVQKKRCKIYPRGGSSASGIGSKLVAGLYRINLGHPTMFLERLGAPLACPGSAPRVSKEAPGHQKERPGAPGSAPRRPKSMPSRVWEWKHRVFPVRLLCEAASERFFIDFQRFFVFFANAANPRKCCTCQQKQRFGFSRCESSRPCEGTSNNDRKRIQNRCRRSGISRISGISRASGGSGSSRISG